MVVTPFRLHRVACRYTICILFVDKRTIGMEESQSSRESKGLRAAGVERGAPVRFFFDGRAVDAYLGKSVATALRAAGIITLRRSPRAGTPRGTFCWMGLCQECTVVADGVRSPACRLEVREGMIVMPGTVP